MNCEQIGNLLDDRKILELGAARQAEVAEHLRSCERCCSEWRAVRALWEAAAMRPQRPRAELFSEAMRLATTLGEYRGELRPSRPRGSFWLGAGLGGALAAGIVVAIMSANPLPQTERGAAARPMPSITMALNESREIDVAINSMHALARAEIRIALTGGVRLSGYDDRSVVSWQTDLDQGINRLTLPLIAVNPGAGQVLVEVEHGSKRQIFVVNVGIDADPEPA